MSKRNQVSGVLCSRIKSGRIYFVRRKKIFRSPPPMLAMREGNAGNGAYLQEKLDYVEQIVRDPLMYALCASSAIQRPHTAFGKQYESQTRFAISQPLARPPRLGMIARVRSRTICST